MWQTDINKQSIMVAGRRFAIADRSELERLAASDTRPALRPVYAFLAEWFSPSPCVEVQTSGSTGTPKKMFVEKTRMMCSAVRTCGFLGFRSGDTALLCMDLRYIGAKMVVVRALVAGMRLHVCPPSGNPLSGVEEKIDFLSVVPMQLYHILQDAATTRRLSRIRHVIVGGGPVDETLRNRLAGLPCRVYSTYGRTETLFPVLLQSYQKLAQKLRREKCGAAQAHCAGPSPSDEKGKYDSRHGKVRCPLCAFSRSAGLISQDGHPAFQTYLIFFRTLKFSPDKSQVTCLTCSCQVFSLVCMPAE